MANLEHINRASLDSALTPTGGQLQKSLPEGELKALGITMESLSRRYPNQDVTAAMPEYMEDLERLALKYSLQSVLEAIAALRIDPEQGFFPTPQEVAAQMKRERLRKCPSDIYARG